MFRNLPPVIKNLIIINILMLIAAWVIKNQYGIDIDQWLGFHYFESKLFKPYQLVTYMFMHAGFLHLFFNMWGLFICGVMLENVWGGKKFFLYYILCGLGAIGVQALVNYFQFAIITNEYNHLQAILTPDLFAEFINRRFSIFNGSELTHNINIVIHSGSHFKQSANELFGILMQSQMNIPTVGASGAVYGILLAFGMTFPNLQMMFIFPPIPIKAKWLVLVLIGFELFSELSTPGDNIAHFAHLGGMLVGFILIKLWKNNRNINHIN